MLYDTKFPKVTTGFTFGDMLYRARIGDCCICGKLTRWVNLAYQLYFCSEEHLRKYENEP